MAEDEKPPTEEAAEHVADTTNDAHEAAEKPEPEVKETREDVPEWGQAALARIQALEDAATAPVEEGLEAGTGEMPEHGQEVGDDNPVKPPWTTKPLGSLFGFK